MEELEVQGDKGKIQALAEGQAEKLVLTRVRSFQDLNSTLLNSLRHIDRRFHYSLEFLVDNSTPTPFCDIANINNPGTSKKVNNSLIKALLIC